VASGVFVQLGAFASQENAATLRDSVLQAEVVPGDQVQLAFVDKLHRVYVGPYSNRGLAEAMRARLTAALGSRAVIVTR
jgi:cell division septation protein DedD